MYEMPGFLEKEKGIKNLLNEVRVANFPTLGRDRQAHRGSSRNASKAEPGKVLKVVVSSCQNARAGTLKAVRQDCDITPKDSQTSYKKSLLTADFLAKKTPTGQRGK